MTVAVETLEKLERKITLSLPAEKIKKEVEQRLRRLAREVKMDGFRPGKVPLSVVNQRYGQSVYYEVVNDEVGEVFYQQTEEAKLRVAGRPRILDKEAEEGAPPAEGQLQFDAIFEVYPDVTVPEFSGLEIEKLHSDVDEAAVDKTIDILRKQRGTFAQRSMEVAATAGDRVSVDFEGKIDGDPFEGGKAEGFQFILGEGQMLAEFEAAVLGMKIGESKTFPVHFPEDYHGAEVAGKEADFLLTLNKLEARNLPALDVEFIKTLGVEPPTEEALRADIRTNLAREVEARLRSMNKTKALEALVSKAEFELPKSLVAEVAERERSRIIASLAERGFKDVEPSMIPDSMVLPKSEHSVKSALLFSELVKQKGIKVQPEQVSQYIESIAASYEKPIDIIKWYGADRKRMAEIEGVVLENNVTELILSEAKVLEKNIPFDELMAQTMTQA